MPRATALRALAVAIFVTALCTALVHAQDPNDPPDEDPRAHPKFYFLYEGNNVPNGAYALFSSVDSKTSMCLKSRDVGSLAPGEKCCLLDISQQNLPPGRALAAFSSEGTNAQDHCLFAPEAVSVYSPSLDWMITKAEVGLVDDSDEDWDAYLSFTLTSPMVISRNRALFFDLGLSKVEGGVCQVYIKPLTDSSPSTSEGAYFWDTWLSSDMGAATIPWLPTKATLASGRSAASIVVDRTTKFQSITGYGFALTQATGQTLLDTKAAAPAQYAEILSALFSATNGLGVSIIRIPIGPCDFSVEGGFYDGTSFGDTSTGRTTLGAVSMPAADAKYVLPVLKDALAMGARFKLYFEAWSFPWWMMKLGSYYNWFGEHDPRHNDNAASYMVQAAAIWARQGFEIFGVGMINEPTMTFNDVDWKTAWGNGQGGGIGVRLFAEDAAVIAKGIKARLAGAGLAGTKVIGYAHNFDNPRDYVQKLLDLSGGAVDAISWHCYGGAPSVMLRFPTVQHFIGECTGFKPPSRDQYFGNGGNGLNNIYLDALDAGSGGVIEWNGVLEASSSNRKFSIPHEGCKDCRGMITSVERTKFGTACALPEYFNMRHYSPFLKEGSRRVGLRIDANKDCIVGHAFEDEKNNVVVVVHNRCDKPISISIGVDNSVYSHEMQQGSTTLRIAQTAMPMVTAHLGGASDAASCAIPNFSTSCNGDWCGAKLKSRAGHQGDRTGSTGLCIDAGADGPGGYFCYGENDNQKLDIIPDKANGATGFLRITHNQMCLEVSRRESGAPARFKACDDSNDQVWSFGADPAPGQPYVFRPVGSPDLCLDLESDGMIRPYPADNWIQGYRGFLENNNQHWDIVPHPLYTGFYHVAMGGKFGEPYRQCMALDHGKFEVGTRLVIQSCNLWKDTQIWMFESDGNPVNDINTRLWPGLRFRFKNKATPGLCAQIDHKWDTTDGIWSARNGVCGAGDNEVFEIVDRKMAAVGPAKCDSQFCDIQIKDATPYPGGLCIDILNGDVHHDNGDWVQGWHCFGESDNQRWNFIRDPTDPNDAEDSPDIEYIHIESVKNPGYCLGLWGGDEHHAGNDWSANGSQMVLTVCNLFSNAQKFKYTKEPTEGWRLTVKASGKCLDVDHNFDNNAKMFKLQQWDCGEADDGVGKCKQDQHQCGVVLTVNDYHTVSGNIVAGSGTELVVTLLPSTGENAVFSLADDGDGFMHISTADTLKCLKHNGETVELDICNQHKAEQKWQRTTLADWNGSFGWNMGALKTPDGKCLTAVASWAPMAALRVQDCYGGDDRRVYLQNWMPVPRDKVMKLEEGPMAAHYGAVGDAKIRGVNLGGLPRLPLFLSWLVIEPFITPALMLSAAPYGATDHYTFCKNDPNAQNKFRQHVDNFYSDQDLADLRASGINHFRLPVGFWDLIPLIGDEVEFAKCGNYIYAIKNMCRRAAAHDIKIMLDLHGAVGSQNGWDHSGRRGDKWPGTFLSNPDNMMRTVDAAGAIADLALSDECRVRFPPALGGKPSALWVRLNPMAEDYGPSEFVRSHFTSNVGYRFVMTDVHHYHIFVEGMMYWPDSALQENVCKFGDELAKTNDISRVTVGEWSAAVNDCDAPFIHQSQSFPNNEKAHFDKCEEYHWKDPGQRWPRDDGATADDHPQKLKSIINAQLAAYERGAGWFFWTAKTEGILYTSHQWDYLWLYRHDQRFMENVPKENKRC
ncbi:exo-1,3-beta-glucanase [Geranomyces variabilis]|nr:exo-1,3-beta-glucanase [Geranomyces variabilis]